MTNVNWMINRKLARPVETVFQIAVTSLELTVSCICILIVRILLVLQSQDWYEQANKLAEQGDAMFENKMGAVMAVLLLALVILMFFCIFTYGIFLAEDRKSIKNILAILLVEGYRRKQIQSLLRIDRILTLLLSMGISYGLLILAVWNFTGTEVTKRFAVMTGMTQYSYGLLLIIGALVIMVIGENVEKFLFFKTL